MARVRGRGAGANKRPALPSAQEATTALGAAYGLGPRQTKGIYGLIDTEAISNPFAGLPTAASTGEFEAISLDSVEVMQYYSPQSQAEAEARNQAGEAAFGAYNRPYYDQEGNFVDRSGGRSFYDVDFDTNEVVIPGQKGAQYGESDAPAPLSIVPTSTTNPKRPRTVAAGYDKKRQTLTVVFRDGTFYNYYEVSSVEWQAFKSRVSKGQYIYQYLDYHPRGPANVNSIPSYARAALYRVSRTSQINLGGTQLRASKAKTKRPRAKR
jgi:hypothetical protein